MRAHRLVNREIFMYKYDVKSRSLLDLRRDMSVLLKVAVMAALFALLARDLSLLIKLRD
jgi:hypothetical protein